MDNWESFVKEQIDDFKKEFDDREIALTDSLLATNLEFVLTKIHKYLGKIPSKQNIKNILLFFYNKNNSSPPTKIPEGFNLVTVDYSQETIGNFIVLD